MKKTTGFICLLFMLATVGVYAQSVDLDTAIKNGAEHFEQRLQKGIAIAVLNIRSDSALLSEYIINGLSSHFVNGTAFTVVDRSNLDAIQNEINYQMSGDVSDETAQSIGKRIGAHTVIIGSIQRLLSGEFLLALRALSVETGEISAMLSQVIKVDNRLYSLAGGDLAVPAAEPKERHEKLEFGVGFSYFIDNVNISGIGIKTETLSFAINFAGAGYHWNRIGIGIYGNLFLPQNISWIFTTGESLSFNRSAFDILIGLDVLIGPVYIVYQRNNFTLPIFAGLHFTMLGYVLNRSSSIDFSFGLGTNITGEYHINERFYMLARLQTTLDFFSIEDTGYVWLTSWGINPSIGFGFWL